MKRYLAILAAITVAGCVTIADVDTSKVEPTCARQCTQSYSSCISVTAIGVPTALFQQCKEALQLCLKTCPTASSSK